MGSVGTSDLDQGKYDTDPSGSFAESEKAQQKQEQEGAASDGTQDTGPDESQESAEATTSGEPEREEDPEEEGRQSTSSDESSEQAEADQQDPSSDGEGNEPNQEATTSDEEQSPDGEGTPEEGDQPEGREQEKPFHYNGLSEEEAENFDGDPDEYVFISGVDDGETAYKEVPDMVEGFEKLQQHRQRLEQENSDYKSRMAEMKAEKEKTVEELRAKVNVFQDAYGDNLAEVLAERHMPEEFQGKTEEDFEDVDTLTDFKAARQRAIEKAEDEVEDMQSEAEEAGDEAKQRQEALEKARDEAVSWVDDIREDPEERFDLPEDDIDVLLPEVFNDMSEVVEDEETGEKQKVTPLFRAQRLKALGHDKEAELIIDLIGERMKSLKDQRRKEIEDNTKQKRTYRTPDPEPAEEPSEEPTREVGNPRESFSAAQR